jgi:hypothetical protein
VDLSTISATAELKISLLLGILSEYKVSLSGAATKPACCKREDVVRHLIA